MLNPQRLAIFATIIQAGSISAAALQLGCGKSVVSRQLAKLEGDLGARVYDEWAFIGGEGQYTVRVDGPLQMNDGGALVTAATAGVGILRVPRPLVADELASGALVQVLADIPLPPGQSNYAVYPARNVLALKTAAFVDFLIEKMGG